MSRISISSSPAVTTAKGQWRHPRVVMLHPMQSQRPEDHSWRHHSQHQVTCRCAHWTWWNWIPGQGFKKKQQRVKLKKKWHASNQKAWKSIEVPLCKSSHYVTASSVDLRQATPRHLFPELTLGQVLWNHIKQPSSQVMKQSKAAGNSILWASKLAKIGLKSYRKILFHLTEPRCLLNQKW